jgi:predicted CXXCH cytochrome family protein
MKLLVIHRTPSLGAVRSAPTKKTVVADWVRIGRNASCEIHLPDPRIQLEQGMIVQRGGLVYIEGEAGSQNITRKSVRSVRLNPGEPIEVGPYRLVSVAAPSGYDGAIEVELVRPAEIAPDFQSRTARTTLAAVGWSKRGAAWTLALALLILGLLVPAGRVLDLPWRSVSQHAALGDRGWNPGPLLLAHQPIAQRCASCHEVAFEHVKDRACLECHRNTGQHVEPALQQAGLFGGARCTSCHRDHKGVKPTYRDDDGFCVDCHRDIRARAPQAGSMNVSDFGKAHPAFRLSVPEGEGMRRVRQGSGPIVQQTHLAFSHSKHLDPKGVKSPGKGKVRLECSNCHRPDASKRGFEPISMARHCQECHTLQFEPAVTTREVPHGKPADAATVIEEFYANLALNGTPDSFQKAFGVPGEGLLRRVGEPDTSQRENALRIASRKAAAVTADLFEVRVCTTCHAVSKYGPAGAAQWSVAKVRLANSWMPHAVFDHKAHAASKCADCHDVAGSKKSSDVDMPTIDKCRECHGGSRPVQRKVTSNCLLCHGFHDARHPWDPGFKPRGNARMARADGLGR